MNRKRLQVLARFLGGIKRKHFDLGSWCEIDGGKLAGGKIEKVGCGTTACAMGWAANVPSFHRDGLRLSRSVDGLMEPRLGRKTQLDAAEAFFGLTTTEASYLFLPDNYAERELRSPRAVVRHIERVLAGKPLRNVTEPTNF